MTVCNMAIEAGARAGMDRGGRHHHHLRQGIGRSRPKGEEWDRAVTAWRELHSDPDAEFDQVVTLDAATIPPQVTWGTSPEMVAAVGDAFPIPPRKPTRSSAMAWNGRCVTWACGRTCRSLRSSWIGCSSAPCTNGRIGSACGGGGDQGPQGRAEHQAGAGGAGFRPGETTGRGRGAGSGVHRRRLRVARTGLLNVPGDERRSFAA